MFVMRGLRPNLLRTTIPLQKMGINRQWSQNVDNLSQNKSNRPSKQDKRSLYTFRALTLYVALPIVFIMSGVQWVAHKASASECEERQEYVDYPYLRIRTKRFPWGDGTKSLFHNPRVNALPGGYEEDLEPKKD